MGRASREKRQRGQRRWVTTKNPRTGRQERFETAISDQGFRVWEHIRVRLTGQGYPDRPPDLATAHILGWDPDPDATLVPGELLGGANLDMAGAPEGVFHGVWQTTSGLPFGKLIVGRTDGEWLLHFIVANETTVLFDSLYRVPFSEVPDEMDIHYICRTVLREVNPSAPRWLDSEQLAREFNEACA